jgi:hypothetical protein
MIRALPIDSPSIKTQPLRALATDFDGKLELVSLSLDSDEHVWIR